MYRKNQFTVYKQLTRFNEANDLLHRMKAYRSILPRLQRSNRAIHVSDQGGFRFPCKYSAVQTQVHKIYRENRFFWNKNKQGKPRLHNSIIPYLVQKKNVHLQQRTRQFSRNRFTLSVTSHYQIRAVGDRRGLMNSKQNGGKDQQVSMIFVQPSRFSLRNQLCEKKTGNINLFRFFLNVHESARWCN